MGVLCPKHHIELKIEPITLSIAGRLFSATIGICPQCTIKYINRVLFNGGNTFSIDNIRYEYLQLLSTAFPVDPLADAKLEEERLEQQRKEELERRRKLAEKKNKELQAQRKEAERKKAEEQKRKAIEQARIRAEEEKKTKIQRSKKRLQAYIDNPNKPFHPSFVSYFKELPQQCPFDSTPLVILKNVQKKGLNTREGLCCLYCSRLFLLAREPQKTKKGKIISRSVTQVPDPKLPKGNKLSQKDKKAKKDSIKQADTPEQAKNEIRNFSALPNSTILIAHVQEKGIDATRAVAVVADVNDQDTKRGIYWVGRTLSAMILAAIQTNTERCFRFENKTHYVRSFEPYHETDKYLEVISRFCHPTRPQTVYLFAQKNIAQYKNQNYEMVTAMIPCAGDSFPVPITVYYDKVANQYFINEATYKSIQKDYGLPYLRLRPASSELKTGIYGGLKAQSELRLYGYSVNASDGAPLESRRQLLRSLIDNGIMTKHEVINHIEWLITSRRNMNHMENAISKWQSDLMFITGYRVSDQNMIWVRTLRTKYTDVRFGI